MPKPISPASGKPRRCILSSLHFTDQRTGTNILPSIKKCFRTMPVKNNIISSEPQGPAEGSRPCYYSNNKFKSFPYYVYQFPKRFATEHSGVIPNTICATHNKGIQQIDKKKTYVEQSQNYYRSSNICFSANL